MKRSAILGERPNRNDTPRRGRAIPAVINFPFTKSLPDLAQPARLASTISRPNGGSRGLQPSERGPIREAFRPGPFPLFPAVEKRNTKTDCANQALNQGIASKPVPTLATPKSAGKTTVAIRPAEKFDFASRPLCQGTTSVVPKSAQKTVRALAPEERLALILPNNWPFPATRLAPSVARPVRNAPTEPMLNSPRVFSAPPAAA
jgi:hypothetical protein